jgi:hypothetical protein
MKKTLLLACLLSVSFISCKKETQTVEGLKEELAGRWTYGTLVKNNYDASGKLLSTTRLPAKNGIDYIEFGDNNTFVMTSNGGADKTTGVCDVNSTTRFTLKSATATNTCRVTSLTLNNLVFELEEPKVAKQPYTEYTHSLNR